MAILSMQCLKQHPVTLESIFNGFVFDFSSQHFQHEVILVSEALVLFDLRGAFLRVAVARQSKT